MTKNDICLNCNCNCIDIDDTWTQCPECKKKYVRSWISEDEYSFAYPSASTIERAWNPILGASTVEQIKELQEEGYATPRGLFGFGRNW